MTKYQNTPMFYQEIQYQNNVEKYKKFKEEYDDVHIKGTIDMPFTNDEFNLILSVGDFNGLLLNSYVIYNDSVHKITGQIHDSYLLEKIAC